MNLEKLEKILEKESRFRYKQIQKAIYKDLVTDWSQITTLPKSLREELKKEISLEVPGKIFKGKDREVVKALLDLEDGEKIETVLMRHSDGRNTVCVSSQVGCVLGCKFCATGKMGFKRNLSASEIIDQVLFFSRFLKEKNARITNVVFMGMGEPFLNYDQVWQAIKKFNSSDFFNIGARRISISTVGITEGIRKMAREKEEINLAISLHAPNNKLRSELIPVNKKYPLEKILEAVDYYISETNRKVMFEYLLIKEVNDSAREARELAEIMRKKLYLVNLIPYNPTGNFQPSKKEKIRKFKEFLEGRGVKVTQRHSLGGEIEAACGQLAGRK